MAQLPTGRAPRPTSRGRSPLRALTALTPSGVPREVAVTATNIQGPLRPVRGAKHRDSGERVTQPVRPGHLGDRPRPPRALDRSLLDTAKLDTATTVDLDAG